MTLTKLEIVETFSDSGGVWAIILHVVPNDLPRRDLLPVEIVGKDFQVFSSGGSRYSQQKYASHYPTQLQYSNVKSYALWWQK